MAFQAEILGQGKRLTTAALLTAILTGCAAQPTRGTGRHGARSPRAGPDRTRRARNPDFTQITQTSCPAEAASYREWVARFGAYALHQGEPEPVIRTAFAQVTENPEIRDRAGKQAEFVTPVWTYLDRAVSAERIAKGQAKLPEVRSIASDVERDYGVPTATSWASGASKPISATISAT